MSIASSGSVFIASLGTETNSYSSLPTGIGAFRDSALAMRDASRQEVSGAETVRRFRQLAEQDGYDVVEGLFASAQPAGPVVRHVYEELRDRLLKDLGSTPDIRVVLLSLHGAMIADGYDDCEGDLLQRVRNVVGLDVVVAAELDPHCHLSEAMVRSADILVMYKEYPHVDLLECASEVYALAHETRLRHIRPVSAVFDCRMVGVYPTTVEPMAGLLGMMRAAEHEPGVLSVSFAHGFPWGDSAEAGSKVLVIADGDEALAMQTAARLGRAIYDSRHLFLPRYPSISEALAQVKQHQGLVVLADTADNAGGGGPADATYLLEAMLSGYADPAAMGVFYDPGAVRICEDAGIGARLQLRLGGKLGPTSGLPMDIDVEVMGLEPNHKQLKFGSWQSLGPSAWIRVGHMDLVVASVRTQTFSPEAFTGLGIDLMSKRVVAVKSSEHYRAAFSALARHIIPVATPGALQFDFSAIPYRRKRDQDFFPRIDDPLGSEAKD